MTTPEPTPVLLPDNRTTEERLLAMEATLDAILQSVLSIARDVEYVKTEGPKVVEALHAQVSRSPLGRLMGI